ncbi:GNAT family N-acetyltransferase [Dactylosporangium sp. NBC_01737]|uniref:GNAT family N-acetyltransferase n=1 Tax=Dactylosporangium sp. NBC_01737 TaxID=2975959 RepID=UPI002E0D2777|nr:GNAT family N-acetyltransferase [Dactylosporangium sp. NBC_01737]
MDPATITTGRLVLTPLRASDADAMAGVLRDEALHEFTGGAPLGLIELRRRYERLEAGSGDPDECWLNWIVRREADGEPIGTVQATVTRLDGGWTAEIAWIIGVPWQGRGYAGEAATGLVRWLREQGVPVVTANIHPDHHASAGVAARAGLTATADLNDGERVWRTE